MQLSGCIRARCRTARMHLHICIWMSSCALFVCVGYVCMYYAYYEWDVMAHWLRRLLSTGGSWVRLPLWPSRRDLGQVLYLQLPVRFGVKLRYSIRAVVGSASEW